MKQTLNNQFFQNCVNASYLYHGGGTPCGLGGEEEQEGMATTWDMSGTCVNHIQTSSTCLHAAVAGQSSAQADCSLF